VNASSNNKLYMTDVLKIVIIGPESTGKSTLCKQLADHYQTLWCKEFAREYLLEHGAEYNYDDLLIIAKGQIAAEDEATMQAYINWNDQPQKATQQPLVFIDTDLYVMKVWCEFVYNKCHAFILDEISQQQRNLYLLCDVDLPWEWDELREYPDLNERQELFHIYRDIMINQNVPWVHIKGNYEERYKIALDAVDRLLHHL
jgi:NadR type nicotinamide-nucleotide adenylyltransferase